MELNGIGVLVAGGASGLGEATARELASRGARVTVADVNEERGEALAGEIGGSFANADVTDEAQGRAAGEGARELRLAGSRARLGRGPRAREKEGPAPAPALRNRPPGHPD